MSEFYDARETRDPATRETDLFARLPNVLRAAMTAPTYAAHLNGVDPASVTTRAALAKLPVLRKSDLPALHKQTPPFGGFVPQPAGSFARLFTSPGPIFEPEADGHDVWRGARSVVAEARAGRWRRVSKIAAGRNEGARHRRLSVVRDCRTWSGRLRDGGARGHGRQ